MKFWFLLDSDLLGAITKGDLRWADVAMARIEYLEVHIEQRLLGKCMEGDEESLCELHRKLMNEGFWERADNLDLRKTVWRRDGEWDSMVGRQEQELRKYVMSHRELVHPNVIKMVRAEDKEGLRMALNHIHYNSLRESRTVKQMKAMVKSAKETKAENNFTNVVQEEGKQGNYKSALLKPGSYMSGRTKEVYKVRSQSDGIVDNEGVEGNYVNGGSEDSGPISSEKGQTVVPQSSERINGENQSLSEGIPNPEKQMMDGSSCPTINLVEAQSSSMVQISPDKALESSGKELIVVETQLEEDIKAGGYRIDEQIWHDRISGEDVEIKSDEIVVAHNQAGEEFQISDSMRDGQVWQIRDNDLSSITSKLEQPLSFEDSNDTSQGYEGEQMIDETVEDMEGKLVKMGLGRKRGRPAKRKSKKNNQAFALKILDRPVVCMMGKSEAEKIFETCLLMGLESQVNREEAIRRIADRLSGS
ncbi:hypothetical protein ACET3Z_011244 [Daucus carota]